ncbi:MAG: ABC transporter ATP-binding protein [Oscillospiraceae bacterium]|nr:ABC transporter ATP-binding protein [Oscillospiraceae bacterium]
MVGNIIELKNIVLSYDGDRILDDVSLSIESGQFVTLLGPSGCGKTTTLRIIGGFLTPDSGDVFFDGRRINDLPPHKREVNTVFQRYALFPHLNVFDNVAFGLKIQKLPKDEIRRRVLEMLEIVDLKGFERRRITRLSGGQQQRVAIARALVNRPKVLLLDEPLGALDLKLRKDMQIELMNIQRRTGVTFIYVTHDQEEALTMSDRVVVMKDGVIQQYASPEDIYNEPKNAFVADFIGESNIFDAVMEKDFLVSFCGREFACEDKGFGERRPVDVVIRPEDIDLCEPKGDLLAGEVRSSIFKGVHYEMNIQCGGLDWLVHSTDAWPVGSAVGLMFGPNDIHIMNRLFEGSENHLAGEVVKEDTVEFWGYQFERPGLGLPAGASVSLTIPPEAIEVVSADHADMVVYLESLIYKGDYNELIVYNYENGRSLLLHSYLDQQVATDIGIKFKFDQIEIKGADSVD